MTAQVSTLQQVTARADNPAGTASLAALVRLEFQKLSKRLMTRVLFGMMALGIGGLIGLTYLIRSLSSDLSVAVEDYTFPQVLTNGFDVISFIGPILIIILAAAAAGSDYSWGTVRTIVGSGVSRSKALLAQFLTMAAAATAVTLTGLLSTIVASLIIGALEGQGLQTGWITGAALGDLGLMIVRSSFVMIFFGALGFVTAHVTRSVAAGIATGIGLMVLGPISLAIVGTLGEFGERIDQFLVTANTEVLHGNVAGAGAPGPWQAAATLGFYIATGFLLSLVLFQRRDISVD